MTRDSIPPKVIESMRGLGETRAREGVELLQSIDTEDVSPAREDQLAEFKTQAVANVSDAIETLDENNDLSLAIESLDAADTFLEATQDLFVQHEQPTVADDVGKVRERINGAKRLLKEVDRLS